MKAAKERLKNVQIFCKKSLDFTPDYSLYVIWYEEREGMRMCDVKMGYVVELQKKEGFFEGYGEVQKVLMKGEKLAEFLTHKVSYFVISARSVNIPEYQVNHPDDELEEWV